VIRLVDLTGRAISRSGRIYIPTQYGCYLGISLNKHHIKDIAAYRLVNGKFRRTDAIIALELVRGGRGYVFADSVIGASIARISIYNTATFLHLADGRREITVIPHVFPTSR